MRTNCFWFCYGNKQAVLETVLRVLDTENDRTAHDRDRKRETVPLPLIPSLLNFLHPIPVLIRRAEGTERLCCRQLYRWLPRWPCPADF